MVTKKMSRIMFSNKKTIGTILITVGLLGIGASLMTLRVSSPTKGFVGYWQYRLIG